MRESVTNRVVQNTWSMKGATKAVGFSLALLLLTGASLTPVPARTFALSAETEVPAFYRDVLPILQTHCQQCHRPGEIAPMPFLTYAATRPWAKAIRDRVLAREMPPWFADPSYGHFANDRSLSRSQIDTLVAWVNAGAPAGDGKDAPPL